MHVEDKFGTKIPRSPILSLHLGLLAPPSLRDVWCSGGVYTQPSCQEFTFPANARSLGVPDTVE